MKAKNRYTFKIINNKIVGYKNNIKLKNKYSMLIMNYIITKIDSGDYRNDIIRLSVNSKDLLVNIENDEVIIRNYKKVFSKLNHKEINSYISGNIITKKRIVKVGLSLLATAVVGSMLYEVKKNNKSTIDMDTDVITWQEIPEDNYEDNEIDDQNTTSDISYDDENNNSLTDDINNDIIYYNPYNTLDDTDAINNALKYSDYINEVSQKWGISRDLLISMIAQESNGNAENNKLMGFESDAFKDMEIKAYNYIDNKYETIAFSNDVNRFKDADIIITQEDLKHPKTQIAAGAIVLNYLNKKYDDNTMLAIMAYNAGTSNTDKILKATSDETGIPVQYIIQDESKTDYNNYTNTVLYSGYGDPKYIEHVAGRAKDYSVFDTNTSDNNEVIIKHSK